MRWRDLYVGLMAVTAGFAAVVLRADGVRWAYVLPVWFFAGALLIVMSLRSRTRPKVLVVDGRGGDPRLLDELDESGYAAVSCVGPERRGGCPVLAGHPCPFEGRHPVAAMITSRTGEIEMLPPCGPALRIPAIALVTESGQGAEFRADGASIGGKLGVRDAVATMRSLLHG